MNTWAYDSAGNLLSISGMSRVFTYDAENRQVSATINSSASTYAYDGLGQRVSRTTGGQTTVYVYDAFGGIAAEYSSQPSTSPCGTATCYVTLDHLGSTRMLTDATGSNSVKRYDYLPFGEDLFTSTNGRTTAMGYLSAVDALNPKFTGKERDNETALDWFEIRAMSSAQGRFQSVDPANAGASLGNPQTWNMYSYVGNNPLNYTDPTGEFAFLPLIFMIAKAVMAGGAATSIGGTVFGGGGSIPNIGGANDGWWNEQIPYSLGGGSLNTGGVYGSGDTGPFINNILRSDAPYGSEAYKFYTQVIGLLESDPVTARNLFTLRSSTRTWVVRMTSGQGDALGGAIRWDPFHSFYKTNGGCGSPASMLAHELDHAALEDSNPVLWSRLSNSPDAQYDNLLERRAVTGPEWSLNRLLGESRRYDHRADMSKGIRGNRGWNPWRVSNPFSCSSVNHTSER